MEARFCSVCEKSMTDGFMCSETSELFCSEECLTKDLDNSGLDWRWDEEENSAGGYITQFLNDGTESACDIFYTQWY